MSSIITTYLEYARRISKIISDRMNFVGKKYKLSKMETNALLFFSVKDHPLTASEFSKCALYSRSNVSKAIDSLAKKDLLTVSLRETDRRYQEVQLTAKGLVIAKEIRDAITPMIDKLRKGISEEDKQVVLPVMNTLRNNIDNLMLEINEL